MAWALATPLFAGPDEGAHVTRAAAVVRGQLVGRPFRNVYGILTHVDVPEAYRKIPGSGCYYAQPAVTAACAPRFTGGRRLVAAPTYEFRNPPLYYALVGWPSLIWPAAVGVYLMRVVSGLMCAALLASALASALSLPGGGRQRLAVLGVMVAATPMVWYLTGVVNASSLEVAAAICLWASLSAVVLGHQPASGRMVARCGVAAIGLVMSRGLSPAFVVIALGSAAAVAGPSRLRPLWQRGDVRRWIGATTGAAMLAIAWTLWIEEHYRARFGAVGVAAGAGRTWRVLREAIGVLGSLDLRLPWAVYAWWAVAAVATVAIGLRRAPRRTRIVLVALTAVAVVMPATSTGLNLPPVGFAWQGRFGLPLLDGVVVLAAAGAGSSGSWWRPLSPGRSAALVALVALAGLCGSQVVAFVVAGGRYGVGTGRGQSPFAYLRHSQWHPPVAPVLLLAVFVAAGAGLVALLGLATAGNPPGTGVTGVNADERYREGQPVGPGPW